MQSNNVAVRFYTGNGNDVSDDCAKLSNKTATKTEAMFCNTFHKEMIPHWPLSFQDDFIMLLENYEVRGNGLQVAQHLPVPDPPR